VIVSCGLSAALFNFCSPYLMLKMIDFIQEGTGDPDIDLAWDNIKPGVIYSSLLVGTQFIAVFLVSHCTWLQVDQGVKQMHSLVAFIYQKHGKISNATNKQFEQGEMVNFISVDAERLFWICFSLSDVCQVPFIFGLAFTLFFYYYGLSFFAGLGVFLIMSGSVACFGSFFNYIDKKVMKQKDARMKTTTESVNNIKMLKLYSWQDNFLEKIMRRRGREIQSLKKSGIAGSVVIALIYFFPSVLPATTFATYIGLGNTISYGTAVASLVLFNLILEPIISLPFFITSLISLMVSMRRCEEFIDLEVL